MDSAYDHIQEESYPQDPLPQQQAGKAEPNQPAGNITTEIQDACKAISSSPWAARLGGFLGTVKKQGEQYYDGASKQATVGISTLMKHTRNLSVNPGAASPSASTTDPDSKDTSSTTPNAYPPDLDVHPARPDSLPADIVKEAESMLLRLRASAAQRLQAVEKAEVAADEALLKFGTNIRSFLRDAVTIAPPDENATGADKNKVLFESKDAAGKKAVHATRFDAQLHVVHSNLGSFLEDPVSPEWEDWRSTFNVEAKTEAITRDLERHAELRTAMEKCVPEQVEYAVFWCRYYFLRHVIESEEQRRRDLLKASAAPAADEDILWDEDSESESESDISAAPTTPNAKQSSANPPILSSHNTSEPSLAASKETITPGSLTAEGAGKPEQPRRSNDEKSVADSDASYDLVSGTTSRAPESPMSKTQTVAEESDEEDWE